MRILFLLRVSGVHGALVLRVQLCHRSYSNKHTYTPTAYDFLSCTDSLLYIDIPFIIATIHSL